MRYREKYQIITSWNDEVMNEDIYDHTKKHENVSSSFFPIWLGQKKSFDQMR